ncbi:MAG: hypothetical protein JNM74_13840, partial [Myxococcales bacterium]|nr:hypothetical protein [Myxococcales bacterium]
PLRAIRFFSTLERIITALTGAIPRVDDIGEKEALAIAAKNEAPPPKSEAVSTRNP